MRDDVRHQSAPHRDVVGSLAGPAITIGSVQAPRCKGPPRGHRQPNLRSGRRAERPALGSLKPRPVGPRRQAAFLQTRQRQSRSMSNTIGLGGLPPEPALSGPSSACPRPGRKTPGTAPRDGAPGIRLSDRHSADGGEGPVRQRVLLHLRYDPAPPTPWRLRRHAGNAHWHKPQDPVAAHAVPTTPTRLAVRHQLLGLIHAGSGPATTAGPFAARTKNYA